jgi:hypothetical protein
MRKKYSARQSVHNFGSSNATVLSVKERGRPAHGTVKERGRPAHDTMEKWAGRPPSFAKPTQVGGSPTLL